MSKKLEEQLQSENNVTEIELTHNQRDFLRGLDTVQRNVNFMHDQLKTHHLQIIAVEHGGFKADDALRFEVDINDPEGKLIVRKVEDPEKVEE